MLIEQLETMVLTSEVDVVQDVLLLMKVWRRAVGERADHLSVLSIATMAVAVMDTRVSTTRPFFCES